VQPDKTMIAASKNIIKNIFSALMHHRPIKPTTYLPIPSLALL